MGKTTLWRLRRRAARAKRQRVLTSSPASGETQLSFAVLSDLLGATLTDSRRAEMPVPQRRALEVALLLDDGRRTRPRSRGRCSRPRLPRCALLADDGPVLIAIDDLQWIDRAVGRRTLLCRPPAGRCPGVDPRRAAVESNRTDALPISTNALEQRHGDDLQRVEVRSGQRGRAPRRRSAIGWASTFPHSIVERIRQASGGNPFYALEMAARSERPGDADRARLGPAVPTRSSSWSAAADDLSRRARPARRRVGCCRIPATPPSTRPALPWRCRRGRCVPVSWRSRRGRAALRASAARVRRVALLAPTRAGAAYATGRAGRAARNVPATLPWAPTGRRRRYALALHEAAEQAAERGAIGAAAELAEQALRLTPPALRDERSAAHARGGRVTRCAMATSARARRHLEPLLDELPAGPTRAGVLLSSPACASRTAARALELCQQAIAEAGPDDVRAAEAHQLAAEMSMLSGDIPSGARSRAPRLPAGRGGRRPAKPDREPGHAVPLPDLHRRDRAGTARARGRARAQQARPSNNYSPREIYGLRLMYGDRLDEARELLEASYETADRAGRRARPRRAADPPDAAGVSRGRLADARTTAREPAS